MSKVFELEYYDKIEEDGKTIIILKDDGSKLRCFEYYLRILENYPIGHELIFKKRSTNKYHYELFIELLVEPSYTNINLDKPNIFCFTTNTYVTDILVLDTYNKKSYKRLWPHLKNIFQNVYL